MSSFLNRLKNLKTGSIGFNNNENDTGSINSFDEEGFLCPICHRKFTDTNGLEHHYLQAHSEGESATNYSNTNGTKHEEPENSFQEASIWKQQFIVSEESRMQLSSELMQQRQRVGDLEEELELLQKQLRSTQTKVIEQSQEIGNLKATKDVYDAQIAVFTDELLNTQGELKEKQNQVDTLCNDLIPRPTSDDVDVLKRELITVQQRMNEMSLEKEEQIESLRRLLFEIYKYSKRFETTFDQTNSVYDELITNQTSQIETDLQQIKQSLHLTRQGKDKLLHVLKTMQSSLTEKQTEIDQLKQINTQLEIDLEQREQLTKDFQVEQKQTNIYRNEIELLTNDIQEMEKNFEELKQEKNQLLLTRMDGDDDNERQNLVRQLTQDKDQFEQQIKDLRKQIKQINEEKDRLQQQCTQITNEKNDEINSFKQQLDNSKQDQDKQRTEVTSIREELININNKLEDSLRQNEELERMKFEFTEKINQLEKENSKSLNQQEELFHQQLEIIQTEKNHLEQQLQTTISQLDEKNHSIARLSLGIHRSLILAHQTHQYIREKIDISQTNLLTTMEQSAQEFQSIRTQTFEEIRNEFTEYLTVIHTIILDKKNKLETNHLKFLEEQENANKQLNQMKIEREQLTNEYNEEKEKFQIQFNEIKKNFSQISESLSEANIQREKFEKEIASLEEELSQTRSDLESRTKKNEMQLSALTENLSTVRSDLKNAQEKLVDYEGIKSEKADLEVRLGLSQDERQSLLERSMTSDNRNDKLLLENGQLAKKISDLEIALQELAREYQGLQIQTNKVSERRWLNDNTVYECMKCNQTFTLTQRKHHCRSCGNVFCDNCSSKTAIVAASSKKPQRVCDQCFKELTS